MMIGGNMAEFVNINTLNERVRKALEPYCLKMLELHGNNLKSISVYGSATGDDFMDKKSNINVFLILERIDPQDLRKSLKLVSSGRKKGRIAPLMLTMEHVRTSTDVFPIEFLEMKENYRLIYGEDMLKGLVINNANLRLQCEHDIKGNLIRLYQVYLEIGMKKKKIKDLMVASLFSLMPVFRNLLRIKNKKPHIKKADIINEACDTFLLDKELMRRVLELKKNGAGSVDFEKIFGAYLEQIEKLVIEVDRIKA